ncbi:MAG: thioredoxin-disulfide reductase [Dehalococcoidales bacterium]|nr:thioredoxin-disulfide reductase [Dehalococcoidales bacterium]
MEQQYDVIIIGGGPAGLAAGLYTSRDRLKTLLIEKGFFGGLIATAEWVENYPGFPDGVGGFELGEFMRKQTAKYGLNTLIAEVTGADLKNKEKVIKTSEGDFKAKAVIIATGSDRSKLGVPGEAELTGKGVSYCATCDAAFFRDLPVAVVGGGNAAISEAIHLTNFASKVIVIHRRDQLRATRVVQEKAMTNPKIEFKWDTVVEEITGEKAVKNVKLRNAKTGEKSILELSGIFISTGLKPNTAFLQGNLPLDNSGRIITNDRMETGIPGVYAAGDVRCNSGMQAICSAGEGATAAIYAQRYLSE